MGRESTNRREAESSGLGQSTLEGKKDQVGAAAHAEFVQQIRYVKLDSALGNVELVGDFLVREILKQGVEHFLFAAAEIGDGIGLEAAALSSKDRIHETGEKLARDPEASASHQRKSADQLLAGFDVGEQAFDAGAQERKTVGFIVLRADDDEPGIRLAFENIGQEGASGGFGGVGVHDEDLRLWRLEIAEVRRKSGLELLREHLERRFG